MSDDKKQASQRELVQRILSGEGKASLDQRVSAFNNSELPAPLHGLIDKVTSHPTEITDADFATAASAGFGDDELFELVICAAVGQANRQYEAGLTALAEAVNERGGI